MKGLPGWRQLFQGGFDVGRNKDTGSSLEERTDQERIFLTSENSMFMCTWERSSTPDENWKRVREGRTAGGERERD